MIFGLQSIQDSASFDFGNRKQSKQTPLTKLTNGEIITAELSVSIALLFIAHIPKRKPTAFFRFDITIVEGRKITAMQYWSCCYMLDDYKVLE